MDIQALYHQFSSISVDQNGNIEKISEKPESLLPYEIEETDFGGGLGWIAGRDLEPGTILIEEIPILQVPEFSSFDIPNCLACGNKIVKKNLCSCCGWPVCNESCEKAEIHAENECKILKENQVAFPLLPEFEVPVYEYGHLICMLRGAALKTRDMLSFHRLMSLKDDFDIAEQNEKLQKWAADLAHFLCQILHKSSDNSSGDSGVGLEWEAERKLYERVFRTWKVNAMGSPISVVYPTVSRINHSCRPNCEWASHPSNPLKLRVRTTDKIKKGESITIYYYHSSIFLGTLQRQKFIRGANGFMCQCPRCLDPSECGSYASAVSFPHGPEDSPCPGYSLLQDPLNTDPQDALYRCEKCGEEQVETVPFSSADDEIDFSEASLEDLEEFLESGDDDMQGFLHPNHWVIQSVVRAIVQNMVQKVGLDNLDRNQLEIFIQRVKYLREIDSKIVPPLSEWRGEKCQYLSNALFRLLKKYGHLLDEPEITNIVQQCRQVQKELYNFYKARISRESFETHSKVCALLEQMKILDKIYATEICNNNNNNNNDNNNNNNEDEIVETSS